MKRQVLISIHKRHLDRILSGEKTLEVRTTWPQNIEIPFQVLMYETGKDGGTKRIRACAECDGFVSLVDADLPLEGELPTEHLMEFSQKSCLEISEIKAYMSNHVLLAGWHLSKVNSCDASLSDIGVKRAPQSWQYIQKKSD